MERGELTDLARGALGVAIASQRPPLAGDAWRITGQAVRSFNFRAEAGESRSEPAALVPLSGLASDGDANAAFRAFTGRVPSGDVAPALVCVAADGGSPRRRRRRAGSLVLSYALGCLYLAI